MSKVVLIGEKESGKTKWVKNLIGDPYATYAPTLGCDILKYNVVGLDISFWDTAGDPNFGGLRNGYLIGSDACIVFGNNKQKFIDEFQKLCPNKPIVFFNGDDTIDDLVMALT